ncbi:MAG: phenylacetate--CoA ligase family protein, partial [Alphaproteobacteria bacterium]
GAEGSGLAWFERLEEEWGAKVADRFGNTQVATDNMFTCELGIGRRGRPGMLHNLDPYFLLEVVDPSTGRHVRDGEAGELVVTSLYHLDTPIVRTRLRDKAVYREPGYCDCGRPFGGIELGTASRLDDARKIKGINVWPDAVDDVVFAFPEVDEYQVVLSSGVDLGDVASIRVMARRALDAAEAPGLASAIAERLRERVGIRFEVELAPPGSLARSEFKARRWRDERVHARESAIR